MEHLQHIVRPRWAHGPLGPFFGGISVVIRKSHRSNDRYIKELKEDKILITKIRQHHHTITHHMTKPLLKTASLGHDRMELVSAWGKDLIRTLEPRMGKLMDQATLY